MAVLLSLVAAMSYGLADFLGGFAAKRLNLWSVALVAELGSAVCIAGYALSTGGFPTPADLGWGVLAGVANGVGTAFLYRGLSTGRMGVVAPVSGVGSATLPVLVGLASGELLPLVVWTGILLALPGIWLVSRTPPSRAELLGRSGLMDGVLAGIGFGATFVALAQVPERAGFLPLAVNQVVAGIAIVGVALAFREPWVPRRWAVAFGVVPGLLAGLATALFQVAAQSGYLSVAAVVTSLYPAFTVILAATVLREHVHRSQGAGLILCLVAIAMVASG